MRKRLATNSCPVSDATASPYTLHLKVSYFNTASSNYSQVNLMQNTLCYSFGAVFQVWVLVYVKFPCAGTVNKLNGPIYVSQLRNFVYFVFLELKDWCEKGIRWHFIFSQEWQICFKYLILHVGMLLIYFYYLSYLSTKVFCYYYNPAPQSTYKILKDKATDLVHSLEHGLVSRLRKQNLNSCQI